MVDNAISLPRDYKERVTNKVRDIFMELIPEDTLTQMVTKEIQAYFDAENVTLTLVQGEQNWGRSTNGKIETTVTPFRAQVWNEVTKLVRPKLEEVFRSEQWTAVAQYQDGHTRYALSEFLDQRLQTIAISLASAMFKDMFGQAVQMAQAGAADEVLQRLRNNGMNIY